MFKFSYDKNFLVLFWVLLAIFLVNGLIFAWTEPSQTPPGGNVNAPLNVGNTGQSKSGGLIINTGGAATGLVVDKGNVGIGTASPSQKLEVNGSILATTDMCIGTGICLSQLNDLQEVIKEIDARPLINNIHTRGQCVRAGGAVVDIGEPLPLCRFNWSSCSLPWVSSSSMPSWSQYLNWGDTNSKTCSKEGWGCCTPNGGPACPGDPRYPTSCKGWLAPLLTFVKEP